MPAQPIPTTSTESPAPPPAVRMARGVESPPGNPPPRPRPLPDARCFSSDSVQLRNILNTVTGQSVDFDNTNYYHSLNCFRSAIAVSSPDRTSPCLAGPPPATAAVPASIVCSLNWICPG